MRLLVIVFVCLYCLTDTAHSAPPSVTSANINGNEIVVSGTGFGAKSPAAPILWENFEDGVAGQALPTTGKWTANSGTVGGWFSDPTSDYLSTPGNAYSGTLAAYNHFKVGATGANDSFNTSYLTFTPADKVYLSYQYRWETITSGDGRALIKAGRTNSTDSIGYYNGPGVSDIGPISAVLSGAGVHNVDQTYGPDNTSVVHHVYPETLPAQYQGVTLPATWNRHEIYKKVSTPGVADGEFFFSLGNYKTWSSSAAITRESGYTFQNSSTILGLMVAGTILGSETEVRMWVDDVYIDNTQARVEICTNNSWATKYGCELQPPSAWTGEYITSSVNMGHFSPGETGYVYVVDEDGAVNSTGVPIILTGTASTKALKTSTGECLRRTDGSCWTW